MVGSPSLEGLKMKGGARVEDVVIGILWCHVISKGEGVRWQCLSQSPMDLYLLGSEEVREIGRGLRGEG